MNVCRLKPSVAALGYNCFLVCVLFKYSVFLTLMPHFEHAPYDIFITINPTHKHIQGLLQDTVKIH